MVDWVNYCFVRNKVVFIFCLVKCEFYNNFFENNKNNVRVIWKLIKILIGLKRNILEISRFKIDGYDVDDFLEMVNYFNFYFLMIVDKLCDIILCFFLDLFKLINFVEFCKDLIDLFLVFDIFSV